MAATTGYIRLDSGFRPSDRKAAKVCKLHEDGLIYRLITRNLGLNKNTVMAIVNRDVPK